MLLYLSSDGLGSDPSSIRTTRTAPALVVANAMDGAPASVRARSVMAEMLRVAGLGYQVDELDLRESVGDPPSLARRLAGARLLWVMGGNTFTLARACERAELQSVLVPLVDEGRLIYAGASAGSVLAGPDLAGIQLVDDPLEAGWSRPDLAPALALTTERVIPHWRSGHAESVAIDRVVMWLDRAGLPHRRLQDGQALVVEAHGARVVGWPVG